MRRHKSSTTLRQLISSHSCADTHAFVFNPEYLHNSSEALECREDFSGIDNEALDFTDLEDYLNNDGDKNGR
ncbi:hypothetical protein TNCT_21361 [Trichonephila clavata]|uniref:Uncharacterized protein n=1 Tax=Trichonephila clavata TaxID=2740835 RepID=A0A8X6JEC9_TRICU|nr:hypothetical protein TNCT_21361 [Trichonephila clavata]